INPNALFLGQWGFKKKGLSDSEFDRSIEQIAQPVFEALQHRAIKEKLLEPKVVYGYFPVQSKGDEVIVYHVEEFQGCTCAGGAVEQAHAAGAWLRLGRFAENRAALPAGLPGQPLQLRVRGMPEPGGPGEDRRAAKAGVDRRDAERKLHAGAGAIDGCAGGA